MSKFVAYYRVSTEDQGKSGLGLAAQRRSCMDYITNSGELVGEFQDVISGTINSRVGIDNAILACKKEGATLVVKEISRISRSGLEVMFDLEKAGVKYIESTSPYDQSMVKGIKFIMAKEERDKIAERTTLALSEIKVKISRGEVHISKSGNIVTSLGKPENLTDKARERSAEVRAEMARHNPDNKKAGVLITTLRDAGNSFYAIAKKLNESGFTTSRGNSFSEVQTKRLYVRYSS